jgi:hypothetical protein
VRDRCLDLLGADAVQPHLVSGVPAQPHAGSDVGDDRGGTGPETPLCDGQSRSLTQLSGREPPTTAGLVAG